MISRLISFIDIPDDKDFKNEVVYIFLLLQIILHNGPKISMKLHLKSCYTFPNFIFDHRLRIDVEYKRSIIKK